MLLITHTPALPQNKQDSPQWLTQGTLTDVCARGSSNDKLRAGAQFLETIGDKTQVTKMPSDGGTKGEGAWWSQNSWKKPKGSSIARTAFYHRGFWRPEKAGELPTVPQPGVAKQALEPTAPLVSRLFITIHTVWVCGCEGGEAGERQRLR